MEAVTGLEIGNLTVAESVRDWTGDFEAFFASTHEDVYRAVLLVTRDVPAAEDAVADAYLKALERWEVVGAHPNPLAWLIRVALNDSISAWRRLRLQVPLLSASAVLVSGSGPDAELVQAVGALPLRQRQVVALRILVGLDTRETGEALGISPGTVTAHLHRALGVLRTRLQASQRREVNDG